MRNDERFEIERAFDQLPHIVGSSWAVIWFRLNKIKNPSRQEYREKTLEYLRLLEPLFESYAADQGLEDMQRYVRFRKEQEFERILSGSNKEVERRYDRYVDYG